MITTVSYTEIAKSFPIIELEKLESSILGLYKGWVFALQQLAISHNINAQLLNCARMSLPFRCIPIHPIDYWETIPNNLEVFWVFAYRYFSGNSRIEARLYYAYNNRDFEIMVDNFNRHVGDMHNWESSQVEIFKNLWTSPRSILGSQRAQDVFGYFLANPEDAYKLLRASGHNSKAFSISSDSKELFGNFEFPISNLSFCDSVVRNISTDTSCYISLINLRSGCIAYADDVTIDDIISDRLDYDTYDCCDFRANIFNPMEFKITLNLLDDTISHWLTYYNKELVKHSIKDNYEFTNNLDYRSILDLEQYFSDHSNAKLFLDTALNSPAEILYLYKIQYPIILKAFEYTLVKYKDWLRENSLKLSPGLSKLFNKLYDYSVNLRLTKIPKFIDIYTSWAKEEYLAKFNNSNIILRKEGD